MSNPAVINLASAYIGNNEVRIEDNWAESIHLHFGMLRVDLTVEEFLNIAKKMENAANQIINADNFSISNFDPLFLNYYSNFLVDLESVTYDKVKLGDLIILKYNKLPFYRHLKHSRNYKALKGNTRELDAYNAQVNPFGQTNIERLNNMLESIKQNGYPYNNEYIILRNDQYVLLDGQHRASCLLYLYGEEYEIPVLRFNFKDKRYNISDWHPWIKVLIRKGINWIKRMIHNIIADGHIDQ